MRWCTTTEKENTKVGVASGGTSHMRKEWGSVSQEDEEGKACVEGFG